MILENPIFTEMILPFLLVFVVVFAILQRSKVLGEGKEQIDAMVALVIGLILIGFPGPRDIVVGLMPWVAVGVAALLVFFILYGFIAGDLSKGLSGGLKNVFLGIISVFTVGVILYVTGLWKILYDWMFKSESSDIWISVLMIAVVVGVIALVIRSKGESKK